MTSFKKVKNVFGKARRALSDCQDKAIYGNPKERRAADFKLNALVVSGLGLAIGGGFLLQHFADQANQKYFSTLPEMDADKVVEIKEITAKDEACGRKASGELGEYVNKQGQHFKVVCP